MRFFMTPQVKKNAVALKRRVSAKFKEYCRSDSAYRLRFRLEGSHQLSSFSSLAFLRNCNIFCFWNGQRQCNWRVRLVPMRITDKRLTHFLFPVTVLTLCSFRGRNENLFEIVASALFVLASCFACCFRVTSSDSPNWRVCLQALFCPVSLSMIVTHE